MTNVQPFELFACDHLHVFTVTGPDSSAFLQSQLTQDVDSLKGHAALAGFCTAQGRLWGSLVLTQLEGGPEQGPEFVALTSSDLMESLLKRLRMFVLRSKVSMEPAANRGVYGLVLRDGKVDTLTQLLGHELSETLSGAQHHRSGLWIRVPHPQPPAARFLWVCDEQQRLWTEQKMGQSLHISSEPQCWQLLDIQAGLPWIEARTQDMFIPQTVNLDLIGGVSFSKGCYPGQEVVARAHYRTTVKRRMHIATFEGMATDIYAGSDVFVRSEPENPVGRIINLATTSEGTQPKHWVLFEAPFKVIEAAQTDPLCVGSSQGPALQLQPLPYDLK